MLRGWKARARAGRGVVLVLVLPALILAAAPVVVRAQVMPDTVTLRWTAPGDDGQVGTATAYELRTSLLPIDEASWGSATLVPGTPSPRIAGTRERMVVRGLTYGTTYYFAIKSVDRVGNWSGLSNVVRWDWVYDTAPPSAPTGVRATREPDGRVRVSWTPGAEVDLAGYRVYRGLAAAGPFVALHGPLVTVNEYLDGALPAGADTLWYQVSASDDAGNESARSLSAMAVLLPTAATWRMEGGYPNPSGTGTTVRIPLVVPAPGGEARIEILNAVGQRVRSMDLGPRPPGPTEASWDGRNDAGRDVAPGIYTAWLIAGSSRTSVRLVRVP